MESLAILIVFLAVAFFVFKDRILNEYEAGNTQLAVMLALGPALGGMILVKFVFMVLDRFAQ